MVFSYAQEGKVNGGQGRQQRDLAKLVDRYSGCLDTRGDLRAQVEKLCREWR